ncbi:heterokaryon incompatibility protein-domain-containing protein [Xylogone sp. PMI_703]|nr:heterokaryon incompatibility protein-domain-containing protein [Xylogone sp. PMI_703]
MSRIKLREATTSCDLCKFFLQCLSRHKIESDETIEILRDCSVLKLDEHSQPFLVILGDPASEHPSAKTQMGLPLLPDAGSQGHFDIMRGWLDACDHNHGRYGCHSESTSVLPTRVIDVGEGTNSDFVRLYCSKKDEEGSYVALSHCWGEFTEEQRKLFCTFKSNFDDRVQGFKISTIPKSFQDAIQVTRELGQRYIWIDSFCIIQDDAEDWRREANTMEKVYSTAYFTIAATSAHDSREGFLKPRQQIEFVKIEKPPSPPPSPPARRRRTDPFDFDIDDWMPRREYKAYTNTVDGIWREVGSELAPPEVEQFPLYICEHIDNFTEDVEKSILNSRGWVFQERALSRRILHFSAAQTYWECGVGVHCETLTLMYNSESYILGDPQFPSSTSQRTDGQNIGFFDSLFESYMQRAFTHPADRAIAFAGLQQRLAKAFYTNAHYGIVEKFLHRNLLWLRKANTILTRTLPGPHELQKEKTPSWSWMAYEGSIDSMSIAFECVAWSDAVRFQNSRELECRVREFKNCTMERDNDEFVLLGTGDDSGDDNDSTSERGSIESGSSYEPPKPRSWLRFDVDVFDLESLKCVVLGREIDYYRNQYEQGCYILIVRPSGSGGMCERVGVGSVRSVFISVDEPGLRASII